jgi:hypothetical protein
MALAHMLHLPDNLLEGDLVDAALIAEDLTLTEIAGIFNYDTEVIELEDQVFFNFRDRRAEALYVAQYATTINGKGPGAEAKRLALKTKHARLVLSAAGILPPEEIGRPDEVLIEEIERELLGKAIAGLRKGLIGRLANPALALVEKYILPMRETEKAFKPLHGFELNPEDLTVAYEELRDRLNRLRGQGREDGSSRNDLKALYLAEQPAH